MAAAIREITIDAPANAVWDAVANFGAVHRRFAPGFVTDVELIPGARIADVLPDAIADYLSQRMEAGIAVVGRTLGGVPTSDKYSSGGRDELDGATASRHDNAADPKIGGASKSVMKLGRYRRPAATQGRAGKTKSADHQRPRRRLRHRTADLGQREIASVDATCAGIEPIGLWARPVGIDVDLITRNIEEQPAPGN